MMSPKLINQLGLAIEYLNASQVDEKLVSMFYDIAYQESTFGKTICRSCLNAALVVDLHRTPKYLKWDYMFVLSIRCSKIMREFVLCHIYDAELTQEDHRQYIPGNYVYRTFCPMFEMHDKKQEE
jgi:hypothetical protein